MASFRSLSWRRCRMQSYIRWPCVVPDDVSTPTTPELPPRGRTLMFCQRFAVVTISVPATLAHCVLLAGHRNGQRPSLPGVCRPSCPMHNMVGDVQAQTEGRPPSDIRHPLSRWYVKFYPSHASKVPVANTVIGTIYFVFVARFSTYSMGPHLTQFQSSAAPQCHLPRLRPRLCKHPVARSGIRRRAHLI